MAAARKRREEIVERLEKLAALRPRSQKEPSPEEARLLEEGRQLPKDDDLDERFSLAVPPLSPEELRDAFGELRQLNQTLRVAEGELAEQNQHLESRIAERTAELRAVRHPRRGPAR
jgi:hypothetical protein